MMMTTREALALRLYEASEDLGRVTRWTGRLPMHEDDDGERLVPAGDLPIPPVTKLAYAGAAPSGMIVMHVARDGAGQLLLVLTGASGSVEYRTLRMPGHEALAVAAAIRSEDERHCARSRACYAREFVEAVQARLSEEPDPVRRAALAAVFRDMDSAAAARLDLGRLKKFRPPRGGEYNTYDEFYGKILPEEFVAAWQTADRLAAEAAGKGKP